MEHPLYLSRLSIHPSSSLNSVSVMLWAVSLQRVLKLAMLESWSYIASVGKLQQEKDISEWMLALLELKWVFAGPQWILGQTLSYQLICCILYMVVSPKLNFTILWNEYGTETELFGVFCMHFWWSLEAVCNPQNITTGRKYTNDRQLLAYFRRRHTPTPIDRHSDVRRATFK